MVGVIRGGRRPTPSIFSRGEIKNPTTGHHSDSDTRLYGEQRMELQLTRVHQTSHSGSISVHTKTRSLSGTNQNTPTLRGLEPQQQPPVLRAVHQAVLFTFVKLACVVFYWDWQPFAMCHSATVSPGKSVNCGVRRCCSANKTSR